ncbi:MAG: DHH family phosphoesterase [Bacilli bacterium]|nr:DHH family phosphoesterase [Bacilli bacterium]
MNKSLLQRLLDFYHISYDDYLSLQKSYDLSSFYGEHKIDDIDKAVNLVKSSIANNEKIIVYGDYDADGIMGTSILVKMFSYLNYVVSYYLPNRSQDGYGITLKHAKEYVETGYKLVITVDNGISAFEPIEYLKAHGVKVLIIDHHQVQDKVPEVDAICHPIYSHFSETTSSGAFTAFMFSTSLLGRSDKYLATLASISLISDMMPLLDYNRNLLKTVIRDYKIGEFPAIDLLNDNETFDENAIGMKIAPRINSIGRLAEDDSINKIVNYFISDDKNFILNYFSTILEKNEERKTLSKEACSNINIEKGKKSVILLGEYKEGLIGLMANSLVNSLHVPTIVFTSSGENFYKGSARSPEGFNIVEAFSKLSNYLSEFGGHASAAGCSIEKNKFDEFCVEFNKLVESTPLEYVPIESIDLNLNEINEENLELINSFSPFGESWPSPLFKIKHIKTNALTFSRDGNHILTSLSLSLRLVGFSCPRSEVSQFDYIDAIGSVHKNSYKGRDYLEFQIKKYLDSNN